jgi:hypothetical protein
VTDIHRQTDFDYYRERRQVERAVGAANVAVGVLPFGALELLAGTGMVRRWAARWILELLPLAVPVVAYQYFIMHFIFHKV